jgi:aldehyde:ferredoxin oxidoreductase
MPSGFFGKILLINLSDSDHKEIKIPQSYFKEFMGGYGLGCRMLYEYMLPKIDPLDEASLLGFFPGLLTSTAAPFSGRYMVVGKSPLTGTWGDSNAGGYFGPEIKKCGLDGLIIQGKASSPQLISIIDNKVEIQDAIGLWGLDIVETEKRLKQQYGNKVKVASIGVAGEKLSRIAGIVNDNGRIAARSGLGAIMGSKNLKSLVLQGNSKVEFYDKEKFLDLVKSYNKSSQIKDMGKTTKNFVGKMLGMVKSMRRLKLGMSGPPGILRVIYRTFGTSVANTIGAETGDSPVKNWNGIGMYDFPYEKSNAISSNKIISYKVREFGCFSCPIQCGGILKIPELNIDETHQPEYETCCAFGSLLLNNDLMSLFKINEQCNRAAIDTISAGATIAFAIECFENGIVNEKDTGGIYLDWGNSESILTLLDMLIKREGFGDVLADGVLAASKKIGRASKELAMHSLGSELPMHDPKFTESLALTYAFDPTPGRHTAASIDFMEVGPFDNFETTLTLPKHRKSNLQNRVEAQSLCTAFHQVLSSAGLCLFAPSFGPYPFLDLINALTGWDLKIEECIKTGLRIQTLRQAFNVREGINIAQNELPNRVSGNPPQERGPLKGKSVEYKEFYEKYCEKMGWNPTNAHPLEETLIDLNLKFVINDLYSK